MYEWGNKVFSIGSYSFEVEQPPYIIAEIGVNHNGSFHQAMELVSAAAKSGANAVKFQTYQTEKLVASGSDYFDLLKNYELTESNYRELSQCANAHGIDAFSACFDEPSADLWYDIGAPAFKVASGDITHHSLIRKIAKFGQPMIVSTGASSVEEIREALTTINMSCPTTAVAILHCVSKYPTPPEDANLNALGTLMAEFGEVIGFSDHTEGIIVPLAAVAKGARIIEKHFTLDKNDNGPDHKLSLNPNEMAKLVEGSKIVYLSLGDGRKVIVEGSAFQEAIRRSLAFNQKIKQGQLVDATMIDCTRPANGISSAVIDEIIGRCAVSDFDVGHRIEKTDVV